jgi:hypothetical protein
MKSGSTSKDAKYYDPATAESWEETINGMKSGATERMVERVPADPQFGPPTTVKGVTVLTSGADKGYQLEMKQIDGKWYVAKAPG